MIKKAQNCSFSLILPFNLIYMKKKPSLADIAQSLNVSKTLVSMVLNGRGEENGISKDTREKVIARAKELNYQPNMLARSLRLGKTNTIGLIVSDISNPFFSKIIRAVEDALAEYDYNLIVCSTDEDVEKEVRLIKMLEYKQVDGMIISTSMASETDIRKKIRSGIPFVLIDRYLDNPENPYVGTDNYLGAYRLTSHLINNGYKKIVILSHQPTHLSSLKDRKKGYLQALKDHKINPDDRLIIDVPFKNRDRHVFEAMEHLFSEGEPDAVFCLNNSLSLAFLDFCKQKNINIPGRTGLASFDDIDLFRLLPVTVTSVRQEVTEIGKQAVIKLLQEIRKPGSAEEKRVQIPPILHIRESSQKIS